MIDRHAELGLVGAVVKREVQIAGTQVDLFCIQVGLDGHEVNELVRPVHDRDDVPVQATFLADAFEWYIRRHSVPSRSPC